MPPVTLSSRARALSALSIAVALVTALVGVPHAHAATPTTPPRTSVSITFDDSNASQVLAERSLVRNHLAGTFYTMVGWVDTPHFLTRADLTRFAADGMEIGGHTMTHPDLNAISPQEVRRQLCGDRAALASWGFKPTDHAYPKGLVDATVERIAAECGYVTARGGKGLNFPGTCPTCEHAETPASFDRYAVRSHESVGAHWTLDTLKRAVTDAAEGDGGWVILTFHQICADYGGEDCPASQSIDPAVFDAFSTWLAQYTADPAHSTRVATVDQVARDALGASYPGYTPAPTVATPEAPAGTNLLHDPSLESPSRTAGMPDCYYLGGWGDGTRQGRTVSPGHTGATAYELTVSGQTSGDAKLVPTLDMGTCSAAVTAGRTYTTSVAYKSTVPTAIVTYVRDAYGHWEVWEVGPTVPASASWATASYTTPAVPAGTTGMSFGLALGSNGTVTTDDYSITRVVTAAGTGGLPDGTTDVPTPTANLVVNPSMESTDAATGLPACYQTGGWGTSTAAWTGITPGATGARAAQLTVSAFVSGDRKIYPATTPECAISTTEGTRYRTSVAYRSTAPITLVVYRQDDAGEWSVWDESPAVEPAAAWATASFTTRPVPAGTRAITVAPTLAENGTLSVDDFSVSAEAPATTTPIVTNGSLEAVDARTGLPACFQLGGWGTGSRTATVTRPGRTGATAVTTTLTGWSSGDAKLLPLMDAGQCAPAATAGHSYRVSVGYRSSLPSTLVVYRRDAAGQWSVWSEHPVAPSAGWALATATTGPAPAGTTALSFGLAISGNGSITTDDYDAVDAG